MSALRAEGHADVDRYPVWMVWDEYDLVLRRKLREAARDARFVQLAVAALLAEKGGEQFEAALAAAEG